MTIEEFIEARLDERETGANEAIELERYSEPGDEIEYQWARFLRSKTSNMVMSSMFIPGAPDPREVLRQCAALRLALEFWQGLTRLRTIAAIWSDHPDYQQEWAK
jgi:hypothetical protein